MHKNQAIIALVIGVASLAGAADQATPMKLPPNHPPIASARSASRPAKAMGTLTIRGIAKTANAPIPAGDKVVVHFYQDDKIVKHAEGVLDAQGMMQVINVALTPAPLQAMVMVQHGEVTYQALSGQMDSATTQGNVEVPVFETTRQTPKWTIPMRHLLISQTPAGVRVVEILVAQNPSDRTWVGDEQLEGATLTVRLPDAAGNLELGEGLADGNVHVHNQQLLNIAPMVPGNTRYEFAYTLPVVGGKASLPIVAPAEMQKLMVMVPDNGLSVKSVGLVSGGTMKTEDGNMQMFHAAGLSTGQSVSLVLSGLRDSVGKTMTASGMSVAQIAAIAGLAVVLVGGAAFVLFKPSPKRSD